MSSCMNAIEYITKYSGVDYKAPSRIKETAEKQKYERLFMIAKENVTGFGLLIDKIGKQTDLASINHKNILDGSNTKIRKYLWGELRRIENIELRESISIFVEKAAFGEKARFRVSVELDELHSGKKALQNHNKLLDLPRAEGCVYGLNNTGAGNIIYTQHREEAKEMIESGKFRKVQICLLIQNSFEEDMLMEIINAVNTLKPYYDYVVQKYVITD